MFQILLLIAATFIMQTRGLFIPPDNANIQLPSILAAHNITSPLWPSPSLRGPTGQWHSPPFTHPITSSLALTIDSLGPLRSTTSPQRSLLYRCLSAIHYEIGSSGPLAELLPLPYGKGCGGIIATFDRGLVGTLQRDVMIKVLGELWLLEFDGGLREVLWSKVVIGEGRVRIPVAGFRLNFQF